MTLPKHTDFILAGDFNHDLRMDGYARFGGEVKVLFDRIEALGLSDCLRPTYPDFVQTYRHTIPTVVDWQLDHMVASKRWIKRQASVTVDDSQELRSISDHNAINAEFKVVPL